MPRAMNPDGTPWWVSSGPTQSGDDKGQPKVEHDFDAANMKETFDAGLHLLGAFANMISKPLPGAAAEPEIHDVESCGICPLCVAVAALKEHEPIIGGLVQSALAGVTHSAERLLEVVPNATDAITEQLVQAVAASLLKQFQRS